MWGGLRTACAMCFFVFNMPALRYATNTLIYATLATVVVKGHVVRNMLSQKTLTDIHVAQPLWQRHRQNCPPSTPPNAKPGTHCAVSVLCMRAVSRCPLCGLKAAKTRKVSTLRAQLIAQRHASRLFILCDYLSRKECSNLQHGVNMLCVCSSTIYMHYGE